MADHTKIEWTEATWNPITGCSLASPGCTNCYAMLLAGTRLSSHPSRTGLTRESGGRPKWTGEVRFNEQWLDQPLRWKRPRMIFVCAHGDLFHENVPDEWIDRVFAVMALAPQHTFQVLTKRSARMREYLSDPSQPWRVSEIVNAWPDAKIGTGNEFTADLRLLHGQPLPNVWLGVSVEDQQRGNERIPDLLATPAVVRWLSCEPLLGPVDLRYVEYYPGFLLNALTGQEHGGHCPDQPRLDWIVAGGESGRGARPMHPNWARSLRNQCAAAGVPFFFKQWGSWVEEEQSPPDSIFPAIGARPFGRGSGYFARLDKKRAGRLLDGVEHNAMPEFDGATT